MSYSRYRWVTVSHTSHMSHTKTYESYESHWVMVSHMTPRSHVNFISFNPIMLNGSLGEEGEEGGKTALIDQRAVAAGKNASFLPSCRHFGDRFSSPGGKREGRKHLLLPCCQIRAMVRGWWNSRRLHGNVFFLWFSVFQTSSENFTIVKVQIWGNAFNWW